MLLLSLTPHGILHITFLVKTYLSVSASAFIRRDRTCAALIPQTIPFIDSLSALVTLVGCFKPAVSSSVPFLI